VGVGDLDVVAFVTGHHLVASHAVDNGVRDGPLASGGLPAEVVCATMGTMSVAKLPIDLDQVRIAAFCRERGIRKLSLFGSVLRDDFDPDRSDVDVLVELAPDTKVGLAYFGWADELSQIIGRKVDLCSRLNPYIEERVRREALTVYEQA
jgi:predicted nucleotidyltransferase